MMDKLYGIIYKITNLINGKIYIGQTTKTLQERFEHHVWMALNGSKFLLHRAIYKYGKNNFNIAIIGEAYSKDELDDKEILWIKYYNSCIKFPNSNGYNMTFGGDGFDKGIYHPKYGKPVSKETRDKISKSMTGKMVGESHPTAKPVLQFSLDGKFLHEYPSATEGAKAINGGNKNITSCCRGLRNSAYGYVWIYKDDYINGKDYSVKHSKNIYNKKPIIQLSMSGEFIREYESLSDGARAVNGASSNINKCCIGERGSHKGYKWMYKEDYLNNLPYR